MIRKQDRRITLESKTTVRDSHGQETETWAAIAERKPSSYRPLRGDERFTDEQFLARQQVEFVIRYSADVADLSPLDRVIYPPMEAGSPAVLSVTYDIMDVQEIGRREGLRIVAARRPETRE